MICWPGYWHVIGGMREPYENAVRELWLETGLAPSGLLPLDVVPYAGPEDVHDHTVAGDRAFHFMISRTPRPAGAGVRARLPHWSPAGD